MLPSDIPYDFQSDQMTIVFGQPVGWETAFPITHCGDIDGEFEDDHNRRGFYRLFAVCLQFPYQMLTKGLLYKYCIVGKDRCEYEERYESTAYGNRSLKLYPSKKLQDRFVASGGCFEVKAEQASRIKMLFKGIKSMLGKHESLEAPFQRLQYNLSFAMGRTLPLYTSERGFTSRFDIRQFEANADKKLSFADAFEQICDTYRCFHRSFFDSKSSLNTEIPSKIMQQYCKDVMKKKASKVSSLQRAAVALTFVQAGACLGWDVLWDSDMKHETVGLLLRSLFLDSTDVVDKESEFSSFQNCVEELEHRSVSPIRCNHQWPGILENLTSLMRQAFYDPHLTFAVPLFHILSGAMKDVSGGGDCLQMSWWKVPELNPHNTRSMDIDRFPADFFKCYWSFLSDARFFDEYFVRAVMRLYCSDPRHVLLLEIGNVDPVSTVAWVALCLERDNRRGSVWDGSRDSILKDNTLKNLLQSCTGAFNRLVEKAYKFRREQIVQLKNVIRCFSEAVRKESWRCKFVLQTNLDVFGAVLDTIDSMCMVVNRTSDECPSFPDDDTLSVFYKMTESCVVFSMGAKNTCDSFLKIWAYLSNRKFFSDKLMEVWIRQMKENFCDSAKKLENSAILELMGRAEFQEFGAEFRGELETLATSAIEKLISEGDSCALQISNYADSPPGLTSVRTILSSIFLKYWSERVSEDVAELPSLSQNTEQNVLMFMLKMTWVPPIIAQLRSSKKDILDEKCMTYLTTGTSVLKKVLLSCETLDADLETVKLLSRNAETIIKIVALSDGSDSCKRTENLLRGLSGISQQYHRIKQQGGILSEYCTDCTDKCQELAVIVSLAKRNWEEVCLAEVVEQWENDWEDFIYRKFGVTDETVVFLSKLQRLHEKGTIVFRKIWNSELQSYRSRIRETTIAEVIREVFNVAVSRTLHQLDAILSGRILLANFNSWVDEFPEGFILNQLPKELEILCDVFQRDSSGVEMRVEQINKYREIRSSHLIAHILQELLRQLELGICKQEVDKILALTTTCFDISLGEVTDSLVDSARKLRSISGNRIACLQQLLNCWDFVEWVKKEAGKNEKELHSFVDIATTNVGESDVEIAMVTDFGKAVTGYAPLIYHEDKTVCLTRFLQSLDIIWNALEKDPKLPNKLVDSKKNRTRIEALHNATGKLEKSTVQKVELINQSGVFRIGSRDKEPGLENCIWLEIPKEGSLFEHTETLSMAEIRDLHSRLMLIGGQMESAAPTKVEIDTFSQIYDSVQVIGSLFLEHIKSGNVLFSEFECLVYCDRSVETQVVVQLHRNAPRLRGTKASRLELKEQIDQLVKFLRDSMHDWDRYMKSLREEYRELNYFSNRQLVRLRQSLATIFKNGLDAEISLLLMALKNDVSRKDIEAAIQAYENNAVEEMDSSGVPGLPEADVRAFVLSLTELGVTKEDALRAAAKCGMSSVEDALLWAMEHPPDKEIVEESCGSVCHDPSFAEKLSELTKTYETQATEYGIGEKLAQLWKEHLAMQEETKFQEFVGLKELGEVLRALVANVKSVPEVKTSMTWLKLTEPNLVVVNESEMLLHVLSLYGEAGLEGLRFDTVLVCNSKTSAEELKLFLQRIRLPLNHMVSSRLFCIVGIDQLPSDVCQKTEWEIERMMTAGVGDAALVLFCSREHYESCHLAGVYARHQRHVTSKLGVLEAKKCVERLLHRPGARTIELSKIKADYALESLFGIFCTSVGYGHGKSSAVLRQKAAKSRVKIPIHLRHLDLDKVFESFGKHLAAPGEHDRRLIHIDILDHRTTGVDRFLFQLLLLGGFSDSMGNVWRRLPSDLYAIEMTSTPNELLMVKKKPAEGSDVTLISFETTDFRFLLPTLQCHSPQTTLGLLKTELAASECNVSRLLDPAILEISAVRCFEYLRRQGQNLNDFKFKFENMEGREAEVLTVLLKNCGVTNPSWLELSGFIRFLNIQLLDYERSSFCDPAFAEDLPGFKHFVVRFMIQMSKDFATRSLKISEDIASLEKDSSTFDELEQYELKRTWEGRPHPYLFFNADRATFSFFGCNLVSSNRRARGMNVPFNLVDLTSGKILIEHITQFALVHALQTNGVTDLNQTFESKTEKDKLTTLCRVLGVDEDTPNPDPNYEITTDCALKMLAIEMRFRAGIPVVIMGETGCGKTRLIQFLCDLKRGLKLGDGIKNLVIVRLHGGITADKIRQDVAAALLKADSNKKNNGISTCLFFDEANTTGAVSQIKEIMCDRTIGGRPVDLTNLNIIAAVNPYRRHSDDMIKNLESAGLGYHVQDSDKLETFGDVPLRHLVYRVQPLPPSLIPLVWDFGRLSDEVQRIYIYQMVKKMIEQCEMNFGNITSAGIQRSVVQAVSSTQQYMTKKTNESSFVSLRDVERVLTVMQWFYDHAEALFGEMNAILGYEQDQVPDDITRSLVLALCVCYRASLQNKRRDFDVFVARQFSLDLLLPEGEETIRKEISACQDVFLQHVELEKNIAKNEALKENLFMMVICIELRIPLFLVGKPGSSKSLAKTIVDAAMRGKASTEDRLFRELKQAKLVSYQCSPLATADGVEAIFRQCAREQKDMPLDNFVAVAVFDEVGLAEDSPKLPLKALHGLLEEGCAVDKEAIEKGDFHHVSFIGISNWALDPAKMNRGIFVSRVLPNQDELMKTAQRICLEKMSPVYDFVHTLLEPLTCAYMAVYKKQANDYEFFGLRDFYSLMKMVYDVAANYGRRPELHELMHVVKRNFSGLKDGAGIVQNEFSQRLTRVYPDDLEPHFAMVSELIDENLSGEPNRNRDNRFLLILTENFAAMRMLQKIQNLENALLIFGSSFPMDLEYTQICRNINKIKICMDTGRAVILLNLDSLYESLYDLLNQAFTMYSQERYVDMGLGSHRLKCHVHKDFRVVVIAEAEEVRRCFPAALINRLEKHYVSMQTDLTREQKSLTATLQQWTELFASQGTGSRSFTPSDVFIGFHSDTSAAIISDIWESGIDKTELLERAKRKLLQTATPESVIRVSESVGEKGLGREWCSRVYFEEQKHSHLGSFLEFWTNDYSRSMVQVTTHASQLLSKSEAIAIGECRGISPTGIHLLTLQNYETEQQFGREARLVFQHGRESKQLLFVQCMAAEQHTKLVACVRYKLEEYQKEYSGSEVRVVLLVCLQRLPLSLNDFLQRWIKDGVDDVTRVTTHHKLTTEEDSLSLWMSVGFKRENVHVVLDRERQYESTMDRAMNRGEEDKQLVVVQFLAGERKQPSKSAAECWSTTKRLLEDYRKRKKTNVRILLLISLPRISSFPGEHWDSYHLDDLCAQDGDLVDIGHLQNRSVSEVLADASVVNSRALIRECVHEAGSRIWDPTERKLDRAKLFVELLDTNGYFADAIFGHVIRLLREMEAQMPEDRRVAWVVTEAGNVRRVLENQTFRQALRKKIEDFVVPFVAIILCSVDVGNNLNNLETWQDLWLRLFSDSSFLSDLSYEKQMFVIGKDGIRTEQKRFSPSPAASSCVQLSFPFSWIFKQRLEHIVETVKSTFGPEAGMEEFGGQLTGYSWTRIVAVAFPTQESKLDAFKLYLRDFVYLNYSPASQTEAEHLMEWMSQICENHLEQNLDLWAVAVHLANWEMERQIRNYQKMAAAFPELARHVFEDDQMKSRLHFELDLCMAKKALDELNLEIEAKRVDHQNLQELTEAQTRVVIKRRRDWMSRFSCLRSCLEQVLHFEEGSVGTNTRLQQRKTQLDNLKKMLDSLSVCYVFLKHVTEVPHQYNVHPLWKLLHDSPNIRSVRFLDGLQVRLKVWNTVAFRRFFNAQGMPECVDCRQTVKRPELLPCMHVMHLTCFKRLMEQLGTLAACPDEKCGKKFPENLRVAADEELRVNTKKYLECRNGMTNFFLDLVSGFLFSGVTPPSSEVIQRLLDYVTLKGEEHRTMDFSPFPDEDAVDHSPVVRSFLLQQLLKFDLPLVSCQIQQYLENASQYLLDDLERMDCALMLIACIEDALHSKYAPLNVNDKLNHLIVSGSGMNAIPQSPGLPSVEDVARTRFLMAAFADLIANWFTDGVDIFRNANAFPVMKNTKEIVEGSVKNVSIYLLKYFCRRHGIETLKGLLKKYPALRWMLPDGYKLQDQNVPDSSLLYGEGYARLRDSVLACLLDETDENKTKLEECLVSLPQEQMDLFLYLSVDSALVYFDGKQKPTELFESVLRKTVKNQEIMNLGLDFDRRFGSSVKKLTGSDAVSQLMIHCRAVLTLKNGDQPIGGFLGTVFSDPAQLRDLYLPSMPHDIVFEQLTQIRNRDAGETPTLNYCPNGHPYFIGNCGKAAETRLCADCGLTIGGVSHVLAAGNVFGNQKSALVDQTLKGYCLGEPSAVTRDSSVRNLTPTETGLSRALMHTALCSAAILNPRETAAAVTKGAAGTPQFFWDHLGRNLEQLQRLLNRSREDVLLLIHECLRKIAFEPPSRPHPLNTKNDRDIFENYLAKWLLKPVLLGANGTLENIQRRIAEDEGRSPILKLVYESDSNDDASGFSNFWLYREPNTEQTLLSAVRAQLNSSRRNDELKFLDVFLRQLPKLRSLRHLPSILLLQRRLMDYFRGCFDVTDRMTIGAFMEMQPEAAKRQFQRLIDAFFAAFDEMLPVLRNFRIAVSVRGSESLQQMIIPLEYFPDRQNIPENPLLTLLPIPSREGLCSCILAYSLISVNNDFIDETIQVSGFEENVEEIDSGQIGSTFQSLGFDFDDEILPLLWLRRNFAFSVRDRRTEIQFDLHGLERNLIGVVYSRPVRIRPNLRLMRTKRDILNECREKILSRTSQQDLSSQQMEEVVNSLNGSVATAKKCLDTAELLLRYLSSVESLDEEETLQKFLTEKLRIKEAEKLFEMYKIRQMNSLWEMLLFLHSFLLKILHGSDYFVELRKDAQQPLPPEEAVQLRSLLTGVDLPLFLTKLTSFLFLLLPSLDTDLNNEEGSALSHRLEDYLWDFGDFVECRVVLPDSVLLKHSLALWNLASEKFREAQEM